MKQYEFSEEAAIAAEVMHLFHGQGYVKLMRLAAGEAARAHSHNRAHNSVLLLGRVHLTIDGVTAAFAAPCTVHVAAGETHLIEALEPVLWACIWDNPEGLETQAAFEQSVIADAALPQDS